jgi:hypothetical protein
VNWRMSRIAREMALAAMRYSMTKQAKYDPDNGEWVLIHNFGLPYGYNYDRTDILIYPLSPLYPQEPPDWFYMDRGLRRCDGKPPHYFEDAMGRAPTLEHWAAGCLHIKTWYPTNDPLTGHSLLTVYQLIQDAFQRWLRQ